MTRAVALTVAAGSLVLVPSVCDTGSSATILADYLPRSAHQAYAFSLARARRFRTDAGRAWREVAEQSLLEPEQVSLPLSTEGAFEARSPEALGLAFDASDARRLRIDLTASEPATSGLFVDLFARVDGGLEHVASTAPRALGEHGELRRRLELDVQDATSYVLRVQPELRTSGRYALEIREEPLLAFPVSGYDSGAIQSVFGAERDGGRRAHRGVDIFAERGTPALAAVDGWVARVGTTPRGGKVVWLQPMFGGMRLYYAHLDTLNVEHGQFVAAGDVVGRVGNTGNAVTTPPHLHFGVYIRRPGRRGGARDPVPYLR